MNDKKPFVCTIKGCDMTFTNEDHLNWHEKKHDMVLDLGLANKNDIADQTPTPTRFIRNCEEVGLFQDLQHVNPFEETFKKAVESNKTGSSLQVPSENNTDDTLHTPHIFPPTDDNILKPGTEKLSIDKNYSNNIEDARPYPVKLVTVLKTYHSINYDDTNTNNFKTKLKRALIKNKERKGNSDNCIIKPAFVISDINPESKHKSIENNSYNDDNDKSEIRAKNRAAQSRCRKRKQIHQTKLEEEVALLREESSKLKLQTQEIQALRHENAILKKLLIEHKDCILEKNPKLGEEVGNLLSKTTAIKPPEIRPKAQKFIHIQPKSNSQQMTNTTELSAVATTAGLIHPVLIPINPTTTLHETLTIIPAHINGFNVTPASPLPVNKKNNSSTLQPRVNNIPTLTCNNSNRRTPIILQNPKNKKRKNN